MILRLALIVPGSALAGRHAVRPVVARRREGRHVGEQAAPALAQIVDLAAIVAPLIDALDGLDRVELVPPLVAGIVHPASRRHDEIAKVQFAAAVTHPRIVDIAVARARPGSGDGRRKQRQQRCEQEADDMAHEAADRDAEDSHRADRLADWAAGESPYHVADLADPVALGLEVQRRRGERRAIAAGDLKRRVRRIVGGIFAIGIDRIIAEEALVDRLELEVVVILVVVDLVLVRDRHRGLFLEQRALRGSDGFPKVDRAVALEREVSEALRREQDVEGEIVVEIGGE